MKKKRLSVGAVLFALAVAAHAQDVYKVEQLTGTDLNGTARYVGMGGAMNALGADLSTMSSNPAGIGVFRRSEFALSGSISTQSNAESFYDIGKTRASFDQVGFVYATKVDGEGLKFLNFGFNYQKRKNFKNFIGVNNFAMDGLSQSMAFKQMSRYNGHYLDLSIKSNEQYVNPLAILSFDAGLTAMEKDASGNVITDANGYPNEYVRSFADSYNLQRVNWGGIQQYDFNISANFSEQIYAGITLGVQDVNYHSGLLYTENLRYDNGSTQPYYMMNEERLTGSGFDLKFGLILRPIETSPFRIGFSVTTPTWYDLSYEGFAELRVPDDDWQTTPKKVSTNLDYKIRTPWKFNLSLGTVIDNTVALDAEYEYSDYSAASVSYNDYGSYDYWTGTYGTVKDNTLKEELKASMRGVSTFRVGLEARFAPNFYGRVGYNYVSSPFKKDAYLNLLLNNDVYYSPSYFYQTRTDYANLGDINRVTVGLGYRGKHWYVDAAYQYQAQKADVYAFYAYTSPTDETNQLTAAKVDMNRSNLMLTIGYKF